MVDPTYPAFPTLAFVGAILVLVPFPWHLQAWNSGTCLYMIWTALGLLNMAVNSIVWRSSVMNYAPVWCDIFGVAVAIPSASLCINRRLYKIATVSTVKRRAVLVDLCIGIGIPIVQMALQYIVEGHRYNIFEEIGCYPATYNVTLAYPLSIVWPLVIGLASAIYCILTLRAFMKRRAQFNELVSSATSLTISRYFRLMALATTEIICTIPITAYGIYLNVTLSPIQPWKGFADAHYNYSHIGQYPSVIWRSNPQNVASTELTRWSLVFCAFVFFGFFGFADEARKHYRKVYQTVKGIWIQISTGCAHKNTSTFIRARLSPMTSVGSLPVYTARPTNSEKVISVSVITDSITKEDYTISEHLDLPLHTPDSDISSTYSGAYAV
ncbi:hypothetical protein ID866_10342 [Astraeus odoratus]|nr:hypothetical protein ID866_10342 [Astraeus odoratus]